MIQPLYQEEWTTSQHNTFQTSTKNTNPNKNELRHQTKSNKKNPKDQDINQRKKNKHMET